MDTTIESILNPAPTTPDNSTILVWRWTQKLSLLAGVGGLAAFFLARPDSTRLLSIAFSLIAVSVFIQFGLRWRDLRRASIRQGKRLYHPMTEVLQRIDDGYDVVSPAIPTIVIEGQTLVVLRAWSIKTGKATLLLDHKGRVVNDPNTWRLSIMLIEFFNACLPGVARNRQAIINTNRFARNLASKAWRQALMDNKDIFHHLGLAVDLQMLLEYWDQLEMFLELRLASFEAEDRVVEQVEVPAHDNKHLLTWIHTQKSVQQAIEPLLPGAAKISSAAARLLTSWLDHKTRSKWVRPQELEAGLKFAYLFQSLVKRTLHHLAELNDPDFRTFQRGLDLARETGLMIKPDS
jgi:hypothetical protein